MQYNFDDKYNALRLLDVWDSGDEIRVKSQIVSKCHDQMERQSWDSRLPVSAMTRWRDNHEIADYQ